MPERNPIIPRALPAIEAENARLVQMVRARSRAPIAIVPAAPTHGNRHAGKGVICERTQKLRYASPSDAEKRRKSVKHTRDEALSVFRCRFCQGWHLGHDVVGRHRDRARDRQTRPDRRGAA